MFLRRVTLENVRSIEYLDLPISERAGSEDGRRWTLLLGENGTGKSTVLKAIALATAGSNALVELIGDPSDWIRLGCDRARIHVEFVTADGADRSAELVLNREDSIRAVLHRTEKSLGQLDAAIARSGRNYFTVGYGVSRRPAAESGPRTSSSSAFRSHRARSVATLFSPDTPLTSLESWAMDFDYRNENLDLIRDALTSLLPGVEFEGVDKRRRELMFSTPDGSVPYRLLSDGYQNVAAWIGDLLYQITEVFEDYRHPLMARSLLLIDELDLHLHPVWQRRVISFLTERLPNTQVVSTTHSPLTVHQAGEGELYFLTRRDARSPSVLEAYRGAPRNLRLDQLLTSPPFGLTTLDSKPVEDLKTEYRQLRDASGLDAGERERLVKLTAEVQELPADPMPSEQVTEHDRRVLSLLESVSERLGTASS